VYSSTVRARAADHRRSRRSSPAGADGTTGAGSAVRLRYPVMAAVTATTAQPATIVRRLIATTTVSAAVASRHYRGGVRKVVVLATALLLAACGTAGQASKTPPGTAGRATVTPPGTAGRATVTPPGTAGQGSSTAVVRTRTLRLARGADRPLPTTVWYPATAGRHPIVLFSHGLGGLPRQFAPLAVQWARAGYVVAAPAYPHTNGRVPIDDADVRHQPADAAYVIDRIKALDASPGDPLAGRLDVGRVAAAGFSAGGTTTLGLLREGHDPALRAAVSVAGRRPATAFGGPATPVLFLHGDRDPVVPIAAGRAACDAVPWPKRFVTFRGEGHGQYLNPGDPGFPRASAVILAFLAERVPAR
jgi:dienelactone hydrolase